MDTPVAFVRVLESAVAIIAVDWQVLSNYKAVAELKSKLSKCPEIGDSQLVIAARKDTDSPPSFLAHPDIIASLVDMEWARIPFVSKHLSA
jgi:hypothetical protein